MSKRGPNHSPVLLIVGLGVLVVLVAGLVVALVTRQNVDVAVAEKAAKRYSYTPDPESTMRPSVRIAAIGDSYTSGSPMGGRGETNWTADLQKLITSPTRTVTVANDGFGGSGYIEPGLHNTTFGQAVSKAVQGKPNIVIVFGSRNDNKYPTAQVTAAAEATYAAITASDPEAKLIVIGEPWTSEKVPDVVAEHDAALATTAASLGATYVDPLAEGWFFGDKATLIGTDQVHPTDAGHLYMAGLIQPHVQAVVDTLR